ncbi:(2Fe-2S)-binding protein [Haloechinothrix sp. YIM 98757]|uniref:Bacterioferritin-associated ferredoxin n=1 Tax=Haloechinothrix aidingensis TaxID=2752311 RepID=A0A838A7E0_9PSEU|nr:(2Fe-2S)-binding protein [Haloechinothrix aidingensis]
MYVCICAAATTQQVHAAILSGARTVDSIGDRCGAGTGCGSCVERLQCLLAEAEPHTRADEELSRSA